MTRYLEEIDVILDRCLSEIQDGRMSVTDCLLAYPEYQLELEPLLNLSNRLWTANEISAPLAFRDRALARFHSMANEPQPALAPPYPITPVAQNPQPVSPWYPPVKPAITRKPQRSIISYSLGTVSILLVVLILLSFSVALAANQSTPGMIFYPIKISLEDVELKLATSPAEEQSLHLKFAARRLSEVDLLIQENHSYLMDEAIANYSAHLSSIGTILKSTRITEQERLLIAEHLLNHPGVNESTLEILSKQISPEQRATIIDAIQSTRAIREEAAQIRDTLPQIRNRIRELLITTFTAPTMTATNQNAITGSMGLPTLTPTPEATPEPLPFDEWLLDLPDGLPGWVNNTPDWPILATQYPSLYPTLSNLATLYPDLRSTPRPYLLPTRVRPLHINPPWQTPTPWPTLPVIPNR